MTAAQIAEVPRFVSLAEVPEFARFVVGGPAGVVVECAAGDREAVEGIARNLGVQLGDSEEGVAWSPEFARILRRLGGRVVCEATGPEGR